MLKNIFFKHFNYGLNECRANSLEIENEILSLLPQTYSYLLIATGGLGRNEQGNYSDIDLLFIVTDHNAETEALETVKRFWDRDLKIGYSIRSIQNIFQHAKEDITFFTALIQTRYIAGNKLLLQKFIREKKIFLKKNRGIYFQYVYAELKKISFFEKEKTLFLNQPNLKNSLGGLRGFQIFRWFMFLYPEHRLLLHKRIYSKARNAYYFIWAVRNKASLAVKRSIDQLQLETLEKLLDLLGHKNAYLAEELLKKIFHASSLIYDLLLELKNEIEKDLPFKNRLTQIFKRKIGHSNLSVVDKKVYVKESSTQSFLEAVLYAVHSGYELANATLLQARVFFKTCRNFSAQDIEVFNNFFLLETKLYQGFYYLHLIHFLSSFIPGYKKMLYHPQLDFYHSFTLGEHSILTLKHLSEIYKNQDPFYGKVLYNLDSTDKETLIYALLLHDIGKIRKGDHIQNNKKIIDRVIDRLPVTQEQKKNIAFLVIQHLAMSTTCQRKDLTRVKEILSFAEKINSLKLLNMLLILTVCDIKSVSNSLIPSYLESSLYSLYIKTSIILSEGNITVHKEEKREIIESLVAEINADENLLNLFPEEYLFESENQDILEDLQIVSQNSESIRTNIEKDYLKIKYYIQDQEGLLAKIVAGITLSQLSIIEAKAYTLKNNFILDYFYCQPIPSSRKLSDLDLAELQQNILKLSHSQELPGIKKSFANKLYYWTERTSLPTVETTAKFEVLEDGLIYLLITSRDFPGVLYFICDFLKNAGFSIVKSRINTIGIRIYDAFYLSHFKPIQVFEELEQKLITTLEKTQKEILSI